MVSPVLPVTLADVKGPARDTGVVGHEDHEGLVNALKPPRVIVLIVKAGPETMRSVLDTNVVSEGIGIAAWAENLVSPPSCRSRTITPCASELPSTR